MVQAHIILAISWILFCMLHSVLASGRVKQYAASRLGGKFVFYRLFYSLFATIFFFAIIMYHFNIKSVRLFNPGPVLKITGGLFFIAGAIMMTLFVLNTGFQWLVKENKGQPFIQKGIHRHVRHPLYTGTFLFIWGLWIIFPSLGLLIADFIITVYTLVAIRFEEEKLISTFGENYEEYKKRTPMIIPRFPFLKKPHNI